MKAKYYILFNFLIISICGIAQKDYWTISGIVMEDKKTPIQFVNVFINNTSIGATTSDNGNFQLNVPNNFSQVELIIACRGFKTLKRKVNHSSEVQVFRFQLEKVLVPALDDLSASQNEGWPEKWKIFESKLLGNSKFDKDCEILDPKAVKLEYRKDKKLIATAQEPILIKNSALGYKIFFYMEKFETDDSTMHLSGLKFFERMDTASTVVSGQWEKNRKDVLDDSFRSFLVALSLNRLEGKNFEVYKMLGAKSANSGQITVANNVSEGTLIPVDATQICIFDKDTDSFIIQSEYPLIVFLKKRPETNPFFADYPYKYSQIILPKGYATFSKNGLLSKPNSVVLGDYWSYQGFSNLLPDDYNIDGLMQEAIEGAQINKTGVEAQKKLSRFKQNQ